MAGGLNVFELLIQHIPCTAPDTGNFKVKKRKDKNLVPTVLIAF